jgi:hypothetical protein
MIMVKSKKNLIGRVVCEGDKPVKGFVFKEFDDFIIFGQRSNGKK